MASELSEEDLRGLYLDWCSTQVARRFLELSGDEIWLRSHSAVSASSAPSSPPVSPPPSVGAVSRIPDYLEIVRKTALSLAEELDLPPFPEWKERYLADPSEFRPDILNQPSRPPAPGRV
jgi:hypothetical protein